MHHGMCIARTPIERNVDGRLRSGDSVPEIERVLVGPWRTLRQCRRMVTKFRVQTAVAGVTHPINRIAFAD